MTSQNVNDIFVMGENGNDIFVIGINGNGIFFQIREMRMAF